MLTTFLYNEYVKKMTKGGAIRKMKGLQALKELKKRYGKNFSMQDDARSHAIEKELKALEIIKNKCVDVCDIICFAYSLCNYNRSRQGLSLLTKQEYDLLKEVLK